MTSIYPYYIDTGLFEGFKPPIRFIVPTLKTEYTTKRMYDAIMAEEKEVYIYGFMATNNLQYSDQKLFL